MLRYPKKLFSRHVSLLEGGVVVALVLALLGLFQLGVRELHQVRLTSRARGAIPKVREETTRELRRLVTAIEGYKSSLGFYPPDHVISQNPPVIDAITNQLLYELLGTLHDTTNDMFCPDHFPAIRGNLVKQFFNVSSFKNCAEQPELVKRFMSASEIPATLGVSEKPAVGVMAFFPTWEGIDSEMTEEISLASWRYNSTAPVHNPGAYDLWIEIPVSGAKIVVGNW